MMVGAWQSLHDRYIDRQSRQVLEENCLVLCLFAAHNTAITRELSPRTAQTGLRPKEISE